MSSLTRCATVAALETSTFAAVSPPRVELYEEAGQLQYSVVLRIVDQKIEIQAVNAFFRILPLETPRFWPSAR